MSNRAPDFFIVGAPKCATTALANFLEQHPDIHMLKKETHFFGKDLRFQRPLPTEEKYRELVAQAPSGAKIGDPSVYYLYSKQAAHEIHDWCGPVKIIVQIRNPVDMMHSLHAQLLTNVDETERDFSKALELEPLRRQGKKVPSFAHPVHGLFYRDIARFPEQIRRYWNVFGKENVKVITLEEFHSDVRSVFRSVCGFLGVREVEQIDFKVVNPSTDIRIPALRILQKKYFPIHGRIHRATPQPINSLFAKTVRRLAYKSADKLKMDPSLRAQLVQEFAPIVDELSEMLGRDLSAWKRV